MPAPQPVPRPEAFSPMPPRTATGAAAPNTRWKWGAYSLKNPGSRCPISADQRNGKGRTSNPPHRHPEVQGRREWPATGSAPVRRADFASDPDRLGSEPAEHLARGPYALPDRVVRRAIRLADDGQLRRPQHRTDQAAAAKNQNRGKTRRVAAPQPGKDRRSKIEDQGLPVRRRRCYPLFDLCSSVYYQ